MAATSSGSFMVAAPRRSRRSRPRRPGRWGNAPPARRRPRARRPATMPPRPAAAGESAATWTKSPSAKAPGRRWRRTVRVSAASTARRSPLRSAASAASWPGPMALLTMARVSPRAGRARVRVSAAASRSSSPGTASTPQRRSAAASAASASPLGSSSRPPARMATTGRSRAAARAAERKWRRSLMRRMSSRMAPVPGSRDSQSSTTPKPMSTLPPMPTMWLKPTPFGSAQSSTARQSAADCDTSAILPGRGGRWPRVAFSPIAGTATPKACRARAPAPRSRRWPRPAPRPCRLPPPRRCRARPAPPGWPRPGRRRRAPRGRA